MDKKILVTGATGLIGTALVNELCEQGAFVKVLARKPNAASELFKKNLTVQVFNWNTYDHPLKLEELIEDTDAVINLAGTNVAEKRWTKDFKQRIHDSRIGTTRLIVDAIKLCKKKPECLINACGVGIYGFCGDELLDEDSGLGDDFLARLCRDWEMEAMKAVQYNVRVVTIRAGIVLSEKGGALKELMAPFKFQFGAYQGSGKQWISWIHIDDIIRMYIYVMENSKIFGAFNSDTFLPVTNKEFIQEIGKVLGKNIILPVPGFILKLVVGEFAENLLTGQRVIPKKAMDSGFTFKYPELHNALENLLSKKKN